MNVEEYKKQKAARAATTATRERCWTCRRPSIRCLCSEIRPFSTNAQFVILIHPLEAYKEKLGTGRLTAACLEGTRLFPGVDFTDHPEVNALINDPAYHPMLLYPGDDAFNISTQPLEGLSIETGKQLLLFVVDGTWPCAKKMVRLSKNLRALPRICFSPTKGSNFIIKQQPHEFCLSTIESIHFLLTEMDRAGFDDLQGAHDNLLHVFKALVDFQLKCIADPSRPGYRRRTALKPLHKRKRSTKWDSRSIICK